MRDTQEMQSPRSPDPERTEQLLDALADLIARSGASSFLLPPVIPGRESFPEPWRPTRGGVVALLRRLAWHAGNPREVEVVDERLGAPPTERKPATRISLVQVRPRALVFRLEFLGDDDVAGTLAHELGVAHAAVHRPEPEDPYRAAELPVTEVDPERDLERGSIATVVLGLGVLAANAAFQQYSRSGRFNGGYNPLEYDVVCAGAIPMSELAYLLAVQAAVRGAEVPPGLSPPQRDEVAAWLDVLRPRAAELARRLGIGGEADRDRERPPAVMFDELDLDDDPPPAAKIAFRWRSHRGGVGFLAGALFGVGVVAVDPISSAAPWILAGAAGAGHVAGRQLRIRRCSGCASVVREEAPSCPHCGAALRGNIERRDDRLEAEERLLEGERDEL